MTLRDHWDKQAQAWARFAREPGHDHGHEQLNFPPFLELLPPPPKRVLDLGCGEGRVGAVLVERGYEVMGVDSSETMVELARDRHPALCADAAALPFEDGSFDLAVAYMSLFTMDDLDGAIAEAGRVLLPGGLLCASVLHPLFSAGEWDGDRFTISGSYFEGETKVWQSDRNGIQVTFADRPIPLGRYAAALENAGFLIERLREIPSEKGPFPLFLHIRAVKKSP